MGPNLGNCTSRYPIPTISSSLSLSPIGSVSLENPNAGFGTENGSRRTEFEG